MKKNISIYIAEIAANKNFIRSGNFKFFNSGNTLRLLMGITCFMVSTLMSAQTISGGGEHSLFLCSDGTVMATGRNVWGELGDATGNNQSSAVHVKSGDSSCVVNLCNITAVAKGGYRHSLFLKNDGTVWACGVNYNGELGTGTSVDAFRPVQVKTGTSGCLTNLCNIRSISAGYNHSLFLKNDGTVWASGENIAGQLGDGTTVNKTTPVQVNGLTDIVAVSAGGRHSLFLKNNGTVWACGFNYDGELGDGTNTDRLIPVQVTGIAGSVMAISAGGEHSLFLKSDGTVWSCGYNNSGELGDGTITSIGKTTPVQVVSGASGCSSFLCNIMAISAGNYHSVFLKNNGTAFACGKNPNGSLGDGTFIDKSSPIQVIGLTNITDISAGTDHTIFRKSDNTVWACGYNFYGQLGDGTLVEKPTPIQVPGLCIGIVQSAESGLAEKPEFEIYPNPANSDIFIRSNEFNYSKAEVEITDIMGKTHIKKGLDLGQVNNSSIHISELNSGVYFISLVVNGQKTSKMFSKK